MTATAFVTPLPLTRARTTITHAQTRPFPKTPKYTMPARMCTSSSDDDDDDDTSFGKMGAEDVYGMQLPPNLSESEKDYLDAAKNGDEFLARLAEIARRMNIEERRSSGRKMYSQTDDYFSQLSKKKE